MSDRRQTERLVDWLVRFYFHVPTELVTDENDEERRWHRHDVIGKTQYVFHCHLLLMPKRNFGSSFPGL